MPEHIDDQEFKIKVVDVLARLDTKMDALIGGDGVEGRVPKLEEDVRNLNKKVWMFGGAITGAGGLLHYLIDFFHKH